MLWSYIVLVGVSTLWWCESRDEKCTLVQSENCITIDSRCCAFIAIMCLTVSCGIADTQSVRCAVLCFHLDNAALQIIPTPLPSHAHRDKIGKDQFIARISEECENFVFVQALYFQSRCRADMVQFCVLTSQVEIQESKKHRLVRFHDWDGCGSVILNFILVIPTTLQPPHKGGGVTYWFAINTVWTTMPY